MPKDYLNPNCDGKITKQIVCRLVDDHYYCIDAHDRSFVGQLFSDICFKFGIEIPSYIEYAIIHTPDYDIKFREFGANLTLYYSPLNSYAYGKNALSRN